MNNQDEFRMANSLFHRRYRSFLQTIDDEKLEKYFNLQCKPGNRISLTLDKPENTGYCLLKIEYLKRPDVISFSRIPTSICSHILSYAHSYIKIQIKIWFPSTYPFRPPVWSLDEITECMSLPVEYNLKTYFEDAVTLHNEIYNRVRKPNRNDTCINWTPAIGIDSDILYFIERSCDFDSLCDV
jgi:hypothetical protein